MTGPILKPIADTTLKRVQLKAYSSRLTRSARIVRTQILMPATPMPWMARPSRRTEYLEVGEPVQMAEPTATTMMLERMVVKRPNVSASWAQKGRNAADVRLKAEMIQLS